MIWSNAKRNSKGSAITEYLAVLLGLIVVWQGAQLTLNFLREHHDDFSWALMIPF